MFNINKLKTNKKIKGISGILIFNNENNFKNLEYGIPSPEIMSFHFAETIVKGDFTANILLNIIHKISTYQDYLYDKSFVEAESTDYNKIIIQNEKENKKIICSGFYGAIIYSNKVSIISLGNLKRIKFLVACKLSLVNQIIVKRLQNKISPKEIEIKNKIIKL